MRSLESKMETLRRSLSHRIDNRQADNAGWIRVHLWKSDQLQPNHLVVGSRQSVRAAVIVVSPKSSGDEMDMEMEMEMDESVVIT